MNKRTVLLAVAFALVLAACGGDSEGASTGADLQIERRIGFAVVVNENAGRLQIGFAADRDATSGEAFDVTNALWRLEDGSWNQPPVSCVARGQQVEIGVTQVQDANAPGLLVDHVVWVACLAPPGT